MGSELAEGKKSVRKLLGVCVEEEVIPRSMVMERRRKRIFETAMILMRTSHTYGPSIPVHWAHHSQKNTYSLTIVTRESQEVVVKSMINIVRNLFWGKEKVQNDEAGRKMRRMGVGDAWFECEGRRKTDW